MMLVQFDCYKCVFNQVVEMAKQSSTDDRERRQMLKLFIEDIIEHADNSTPPEMAAMFYTRFCEKTGINDPFAEVKHRSTMLAKELFPELQEMVRNSSDPFETALRTAIGGNVIDFGANPDFKLADAAEKIRETANLPLDENMLALLREKCKEAKDIFYILDNCGEAVIDRLLIDQIGAEKITLGVRGKPILNDVTRAELSDSGLSGLPVIDTGDRAPGVSLKNSSPEFLEKLASADLVITKGQGNFESLADRTGKKVFFLFRVKCPVIRMQTGALPGSLQIRQGII